MSGFSIVLVFIFYVVSLILKSKKDQKEIIERKSQPSSHTPPQRVQPERPKQPMKQRVFDQVEERLQSYTEKTNPTASVTDEEEQLTRILEERRRDERKVEPSKESNVEQTNPIYGQEIGHEVDFKFDQEAVLKGVIMSEILSKPKSMKN